MARSSEFDRIQQALRTAIATAKQEAKQFKGAQIQINGNYNGQPYGRSKKNLKGTVQTIKSVYVTDDEGLMVSIDKDDCNLLLARDEWEFVG